MADRGIGANVVIMRHERRLVLHPALPLVRPRGQPARRRCGAADPRRAIVRSCVSVAWTAAASGAAYGETEAGISRAQNGGGGKDSNLPIPV